MGEQKHTIKIDILHIIVAVVVIALAVFFVSRFFGEKNESQTPDDKYWTEPFPFGTDPALHWHAYPKFSLCGEEKSMLDVLDMAGVKFPGGGSMLGGDPMLGPESLHVHKTEPWIHIESPPPNRKAITLGKFFKNINVKFSNAGILNYDKPDSCNNGKENSLKVSVNGKQTTDPENHVLADGEQILVEFN